MQVMAALLEECAGAAISIGLMVRAGGGHLLPEPADLPDELGPQHRYRLERRRAQKVSLILNH